MTNVNFFYAQYVTQSMDISMDDQGLFCVVPSESDGIYYKVRVDESGVCPVATHCACQGFKYRHTCKHAVIISEWYAKMYKSNIEKHEAKMLQASMNASELLDEQYEEIESEEQITATEVVNLPFVAPKVANITPNLVKSEGIASTVKKCRSSQGRMPQHVAVATLEPAKRDTSSLNAPKNWTSILPSRQKIA